MRRDLDIENSDAFFNMRSEFWQESRDMALAEKERNKPSSRQTQDDYESRENNEEKSVTISGS